MHFVQQKVYNFPQVFPYAGLHTEIRKNQIAFGNPAASSKDFLNDRLTTYQLKWRDVEFRNRNFKIRIISDSDW
jgi:hypothetical protein